MKKGVLKRFVKKALVISVVCGIMITASACKDPKEDVNVTATTTTLVDNSSAQVLNISVTGSDWQAGHNKLSLSKGKTSSAIQLSNVDLYYKMDGLGYYKIYTNEATCTCDTPSIGKGSTIIVKDAYVKCPVKQYGTLEINISSKNGTKLSGTATFVGRE